MMNMTDEVIPLSQPLTATLQLTEQQRAQLRRSQQIIAEAEAYVIDCPEVADMANEELKRTKAQARALEAMRDDFIKPARDLLAAAKRWFQPTLEAYATKEQILKNKLLAWQKSEEERIEAQRRAAEEEARRIREEAEKQAAAERARALEAERKARAEAEAAEARRREAEEAARAAREAGNRKAAAEAERRAQAAAAERARQEEAERLAREEGERRANEVRLAAAAQAQAAQEAAATEQAHELKGFSAAANWTVELAPGVTEADAVMKIAAAVFGLEITGPETYVATARTRPELIALLKLDWVAARRQGVALKKHFNVPGLVCLNKPKAVSRGG